MKQTEKPFEVGGQRFTAVRFQAPLPHWRVRLDETGETLSPGAGGIPTNSVKSMQENLQQLFEHVSASVVADFRDRLGLGKAPIGKSKREVLHIASELTSWKLNADPSDLRRTPDGAEAPPLSAEDAFELGCWLHHLAQFVSHPARLRDRIECVRRLFAAGIRHPGYRFFKVFGFGQRQFEACLAMEDGDQVRAALAEIARLNPNTLLAAVVQAEGWLQAVPVEVQ